MKVVTSLGSIDSSSGTVVTIGNFDGMHLGHQALIKAVVEESQSLGLPSVMLTFEPYPEEFFKGKKHSVRLMRSSEKAYWLQQYAALDYMLFLRFQKALSSLSAQDFVEKVLINQLKAKVVVIGEDFRFGYGREGDVAYLEKRSQDLGFTLIVVADVVIGGERVSSSLLRQNLSLPNLKLASVLLGRPYSLMGRVHYGSQRGREWGFPTANIALRRHLSPLTGIYVVEVVGEDFKSFGVASIGYRPVFELTRPLLEVYLLDFDRDIYGQRLQVNFLHFLRPELNFSSVPELITQIEKDIHDARVYIQKDHGQGK